VDAPGAWPWGRCHPRGRGSSRPRPPRCTPQPGPRRGKGKEGEEGPEAGDHGVGRLKKKGGLYPRAIICQPTSRVREPTNQRLAAETDLGGVTAERNNKRGEKNKPGVGFDERYNTQLICPAKIASMRGRPSLGRWLLRSKQKLCVVLHFPPHHTMLIVYKCLANGLMSAWG